MPENPDGSSSPSGDADLRRNVTLFVLFRVFFNARFYYPVFAIIFLDFGLSWEEFFVLNIGWAIASILLEVPSGALADQLGRRALVVYAAVLMVLEMLILCLTPIGGGAIVFWLFLINRIVSGGAEAAASGADEALAYDSLPENEREKTWPKVQSKLMLFQGLGMIFALLLGSCAYSLDQVLDFLGLDWEYPHETSKLPLWMCLGSAFVTLAVTLLMKEPPRSAKNREDHGTVVSSFRRTLGAGRWILQHSGPFFILLLLVSFDSLVRLFYTVSSSYYRVIQIEPIYFGFIGITGNLFGMLFATMVGYLIGQRSPRFNYIFAACSIMTGLVLMALQIPIWGFLVILPLGMGMRLIHAASSQYLNRVTDSEHRATVLSFRGLALMVAYGFINVVAIAQIGISGSGTDPNKPTMGANPDDVIRVTSPWWWIWFAIAILNCFLVRYFWCRKPIGEMVGASVNREP